MKQNKFNRNLRVSAILILLILIALIFYLLFFHKSISKDDKTSEEKNTSTEQIRDTASKEDTMQANDITTFNSKTSLQVKNFSVKLFQEAQNKNKNTLISPISVLYALGVTANGANNHTKDEFEQVIGVDMDAWNQFMYAYQKNQPVGEKHQIKIANSLWINQKAKYELNQNYKKNIEKNFQSEIFQKPFEKKTVDQINEWVDTNTNHMIPSIIDELNENQIMEVINAVSFEAQWEQVYTKEDVNEADFTQEDQSTQQIKMMYQKEHKYIEGDNETGFIKYYADHSFAFVALLPKEGQSMEDYIAKLSGEKLDALLTQAKDISVETGIPKFKTTDSMQLSKSLEDMGIQDAFSSKKADFSNMSEKKEKGLFIGNILHKTHIVIDEKGTKAGAATSVSMEGTSLQESPEVYLDRPFVYIIVDCKTNTPIFMGSVYHIK